MYVCLAETSVGAWVAMLEEMGWEFVQEYSSFPCACLFVFSSMILVLNETRSCGGGSGFGGWNYLIELHFGRFNVLDCPAYLI